MIIKQGNAYQLNTKHTSYVFHCLKTGHLEHLHYGKKVHLDIDGMQNKKVFAPGCAINYSQDFKEVNLESLCLEMSSLGKGDLRLPFIDLEFEDGNRTCDFIFDHDFMDSQKKELKTLPSSYGENVHHLCIVLKEKHNDVYLELHYYTFDECDIISKEVKLINQSNQTIHCRRLMSNQLDLEGDDYIFTTFNGAWAREMKKTEHKVENGIHENGSICGYSSNHANPFVMISQTKTDENNGECFGFNLVYSGNHIETVEKNSFQKVRFLQGIHPIHFDYILSPNESLETPEAILSYSANGYNELSSHFHSFINNHIVRGEWKQKERPILLNSWEAAYFDINEDKLVELAKVGKDVGIELFVMDDGWFGTREDDQTSLGDWEVNLKKFPNGLEGISKKIHDLGLQFGIWVEPEMVNVNSNLYREHPEWTLMHPNREHSEGRNQRVLDLCNPMVQDYIVESMTKVFESSQCDYVKWDMNRMMSDMYSSYLPMNRQNEVAYRYMVGFYSIMKRLTTSFPHILFEGCASGGNRFDLGILCYYPQIWISDNTDALVRTEIQNNVSYGYPLSVMGAHVSSVPNHQTLRITPLHTRFHVACFGVLGYELNLLTLSKEQLNQMKDQISFYKEIRHLIFNGHFYRIRSFNEGYSGVLERSASNGMEWSLIDEKKENGLSFLFQKLVIPNTTYERIQPLGLKEEDVYHIVLNNDIQIGDYPMEKEDGYAYGDTLMYHGFILKQAYANQGYTKDIRPFSDFESRIYRITKKDE